MASHPTSPSPARTILRKLIPFGIRNLFARAKGMRRFEAEAAEFQFESQLQGAFPNIIATHASPLRREGTTYEPALQQGKETNVALAASRIDGIVVPPGRVFSYHHAVGPPTKARGFVLGSELHDGSLKPGIGGGCCQVSNLLYALALLSGLEIVQRHRHGLDLFPDSGRTMPFGCGATVYFPSMDLRFRNPHPFPVRIGLAIENNDLVGKVSAQVPIAESYEIYEINGVIEKRGNVWMRENRVGRRNIRNGEIVKEEEVAHNVARCAYDPESP